MPLHLLGKKSWNVYNTSNIERVRRDEAEAKKREEESERQARQNDADERLAALRGQKQQGEERGFQDAHEQNLSSHNGSTRHGDGSRYKKRKLVGEDDTEHEIRLAQARYAATNERHVSLLSKTQPTKQKEHDTPLTDANGNISLIPQTDNNNSNYAHKKPPRQDENPTHFYLSSATSQNPNSQSATITQPWYSSTKPSSFASKDSNEQHATRDEDQWGSASSAIRRQEREAARLSSNDPLAAMKLGVKRLRDTERERNEWRAQRERDLKEVEDLAKRERRRRRRDDRKGRDEEQHRSSERHSHADGRRRRRHSSDRGHDDEYERQKLRASRDPLDRARKQRHRHEKRRPYEDDYPDDLDDIDDFRLDDSEFRDNSKQIVEDVQNQIRQGHRLGDEGRRRESAAENQEEQPLKRRRHRHSRSRSP